jgi:hypothetical protein
VRRSSRHRLSVWRVRARRSRPVEVARYTRRMLVDEGPRHTGRRAVSFATRRVAAAGRALTNRGPVGRVRRLLARLLRSLGRHGVGGTAAMGYRLVRHHLLHTVTRLRAAWGRLRARVTDR